MDSKCYHLSHITIKSLEDFIRDKGVSASESLLLNIRDFDNLALRHRESSNLSLPNPYYILRVLIQIDYANEVGINQIRIGKNESETLYNNFDPYHETIYRCGYCGNIVDRNGNELNNIERQNKISILEKYKHAIDVQNVPGKCCIDEF